jgi:hypothetical protein
MRGQLSLIEQLPPHADEAVAWAITELEARRLTQKAIMAGLNERLEALGLRPVGKSSFYRWALKGLNSGFPARGVTASVRRCPTCGAIAPSASSGSSAASSPARFTVGLIVVAGLVCAWLTLSALILEVIRSAS